MIRLMIMDLDGTCVNTLESLAYSTNNVLKHLGLKELPLDNYRLYCGDGYVKQVKRALRDAGDPGLSHLDEALALYKKEFRKGCTYHVKSYPELTETLEDLRDYGLQFAICTNKPQENAEAVIHKVYGRNMFDYILGDGAGFPRKPDPESCLFIAEHLGVTPEQCIYVGDSNTDMKTGLAAGMFTIGVTWGFRGRAELEACEPDKIIDHPRELLDIEI